MLGGEVAFDGDGDGDGELGEIAVAEDFPELGLGLEHPGGGPAQAHVAVLPVLDVAAGAPDGAGHRLDRVRALERALEFPATPRRVSVSFSPMPSRRDAAAPGCERSSSPASRASASSACWWFSDAHAFLSRAFTSGRSRSGR